MQEYTTTKGATIRTGQRYHDRRESNRRTLRVDAIHDTGGGWADVELTVVLVDGKEPRRPRTTRTTADRLTGRDFVLITEEG